MKLKSNLSTLILFVFTSLLIIVSCTKDDSNALCGEEDIGEFNLLESSRNSIPYMEDMNLYFQDSTGNQVIFELGYGNGGYAKIDMTYLRPCENDNAKDMAYKANVDYYRFDINETTQILNLKLYIKLSVNPFFLDIDTVMVSDRLNIYVISETDTTASGSDFAVLVNPRDLSEEDINNIYEKPIDEIVLLGKTFYNVFTNYNIYTNVGLRFYYNYESGLIAFTDRDKKLWVLDKTEKINK